MATVFTSLVYVDGFFVFCDAHFLPTASIILHIIPDVMKTHRNKQYNANHHINISSSDCPRPELQTENRILLTALYNTTGMSKVVSIKSSLLKLIDEARY